MDRAQARALGLKRYTVGKVCPKGHSVERFVSTGQCVECLRSQNELWRKANPEKYRECQRISNAKQFAADPESARAKKRASAIRNADTVKRRFKRWYEINRQRVIDAAKAWAKNNPEWNRLLRRQIAANRRARVTAVGGSFSLRDIQLLYVNQRGCCKYCTVFLADDFHIDHKMPIALGGSNFPKNLQLLCPTCNLRKGAKHPDEFEAEIARRA